MWAGVAFVGLLIAAVAGPLYASYYWPKELSPNAATANGFGDFNAMMRAVEKAKPVAATANMLTAFGRFLMAGATIGLVFTLVMHFRKRKRIRSKPVDEELQSKQTAE